MHKQINNSEYLKLQEIYLNNRCDKYTLGKMLTMVGDLTIKYTKQYLGCKHLNKSQEDIEDIVSKVQLRVLERYVNNPNWCIKSSLTGSLYFDVMKVIFNKQNKADVQQGMEDKMASLEELLGL
jgi:hypothetical protein